MHQLRYKRLALPIALIVLVTIVAGVISAGSSDKTAIPYTPVKSRIVDHTEYFKKLGITEYKGSVTCIQCHMAEVVQFFHSYHYQMASWNYDIVGRDKIWFGGRVVFNGFCLVIYLDNGTKPLNWIGYIILQKAPPGYENLVGSFTGMTGCSSCHGVSMGLPLSTQPTMEQLSNIDCLACHAHPSVYVSGRPGVVKGYKNVTKDEQGRLRYVVKVDIETLAKNIIDKPMKENCLACHAYSGGGAGVKRPDLSPDLYTGKTKDGRIVDVHIASGLNCIDCHPGEKHRFATSSADTWNREGTGPGEKARQCVECHGTEPHKGLKGWFLNRYHLEKVACQTCHIPYIAGGDYPTERYRDWSAATFLPKEPMWKFSVPDPTTRDTSKWYLVEKLEPVYAWYNGKREVYIFPDKVTPIKDSKLELQPANGVSAGVIYHVKPVGSRDDPNAKIYPFRLHRSIVPYSTVNQTPVPMRVGIVFATGDTKLATLMGANASNIKWDNQTYVTYVRYMQINHGVKPASEALGAGLLGCFDCHGPTVRKMPWPELGYGNWPEIAFTLISIAIVAAVAGIAWFFFKKRRS